MKFVHFVVGAGVAAGLLTACQSQKKVAATTAPAAPTAPAPPAFSLKNENDSLSYSIGVSIGKGLKGQELDSINTEVLYKALKSAYGSDSLLIGSEQANQFLSNYFQNLQIKKAEAAKQASEKFLAENKAKPGVITTASGLQYQVLQEGTGAKPKATDKVTAHYKGMLIDGKVFDSSYERNEPIKIGVNEVIPGWTEALQLMKVGSKWKIVVPSNLAYGERGAGRDIPPNSTLIFEMELISIGK